MFDVLLASRLYFRQTMLLRNGVLPSIAVTWALAAVLLLGAGSPTLWACDGGTVVPEPGNNTGLVEDCKVLLALRDGVAGANLGWDTQLAITSWPGVVVSGSPRRVTELRLPGNQLTGFIPPELAQLTHLKLLDFSRNRLTGFIPPELAQLTQLQGLDFRGNGLEGPIPVELAQLSQLSWLDLGTNQLVGPIPVELGQLTQLEWLSLSGNQLTGTIPVELGQLTRLGWLVLGGNQLLGPIPPGLGQLSHLEWLDLGLNQLVGPIPLELAQLTQLELFWLGGNQLTGPIPPGLGQLTQLRWLDFSRNQLTGPIPPGLGQLSQLQKLLLYDNQLTGSIPVELGQLSQKLESLGLGSNRLTGPIPAELGQLSHLGVLSLGGNQLTGLIPSELAKLSLLTGLYLHDNQLTGSIPPELGRLFWLHSLHLYDNQLTGPIPPELGKLSHLDWLDLSRNQLTGPIPVELSQLSKLRQLHLDSNQLTGPIPPELAQLSQLWYLHLQHNQLTGPIPPELGRIPRLDYFSFRGNQLTGGFIHIPDLYVLHFDAIWVAPGQIEATWDDSGDPTASYEYSWSNGPIFPPQGRESVAPKWSDWEEIPATMLRAGEGVTITAALIDLPTDIGLIRVRARNRNGFSRAEYVRMRSLENATSFWVPVRGSFSLRNAWESDSMDVGYARIEPHASTFPPSAVAIFGFTKDGVRVTEAAVPATAATLAGRIFAEVDGPVTTGVAMANPNDETATVSFTLTDQSGVQIGSGIFSIEANTQIAKFLEEAPFNAPKPMIGTFSYTSSIPVATVALRGLTNARSEFLITTLPVAPLSSITYEEVVLPHFVDGSGWTTQIVLVNPTDHVIGGSVRFFGQGRGSSVAPLVPLTLDDGRIGSEFSYAIAPRSSRRLHTMNPAGVLHVGSVRVVPDTGAAAPAALVIFSLEKEDVTVSEVGVASLPAGSGFRMYVELEGGPPGQAGSIQTGLSIANAGSTAATVVLELTDPRGHAVGPRATLQIPRAGQVAKFIYELFPEISAPFSGILRIASTFPSPFHSRTTDLAVVGLRGRTNERGDFLMTSIPPINESVSTASATFFPYIADGDGWSTEFILFGGTAGQSSAGHLGFFTQSGAPWFLNLR